jgi:MerR-like DNA binding protein
MQMIQTADACRLTGLTSHQLREWCARRAILPPDVPGEGRGRHALFSWQTVLALRLLHELHERFGAEVGAWKSAVEECRQLLNGRSFPGLWTTAVVFTDRHHASLSEGRDFADEAFLVLPLEPHLQAIADDFAFPPQAQFPLFRAVELRR